VTPDTDVMFALTIPDTLTMLGTNLTRVIKKVEHGVFVFPETRWTHF